ncbi:MAG: hypothetical protein U0183_32520 [Polyangiaceae bacterium]
MRTRSALVPALALVLTACATPPDPSAPAAPQPLPPSLASAVNDAAVNDAGPPGPVVVDAASDAVDAGATRASGAPRVRATKWVCEDQECEAMPTLAYDYLPAVTEAGDLVAFVEERDGWGHTAKIGVHLVSGGRETAYLPTVTRETTSTFAEYSKRASAHQAVIAAANAELAKHTLRPLFPLTEAGEEVFVNGAWTKPSAGATGKLRRVYTYANVRVLVTEPADDDWLAKARFASIAVLVDGKEVVRKTGGELPDSAGCSARRMQLDGVRVESRTLALTYTNGTTSHACDGRSEPQVHHVIRW